MLYYLNRFIWKNINNITVTVFKIVDITCIRFINLVAVILFWKVFWKIRKIFMNLLKPFAIVNSLSLSLSLSYITYFLNLMVYINIIIFFSMFFIYLNVLIFVEFIFIYYIYRTKKYLEQHYNQIIFFKWKLLHKKN